MHSRIDQQIKVKQMKLTKEQQKSLYRVWKHQNPGVSYLAFRRSVVPELYGKAIMVKANSMWIGVEPDGYAHS